MAKKKLCELLDAYNRAVKLHSELKDVEIEVDKDVEVDADMEMRKSSIESIGANGNLVVVPEGSIAMVDTSK